MRKFLIPENLLAGVIAYLKARPYSEVEQAVPLLERLEEFQDTQKAESPH